jgi:hypothetical protein
LASYFSQRDAYSTEQLQQLYGVGCDKDIDAVRLGQRKEEGQNSACYDTCTSICCDMIHLQIVLPLILYRNFMTNIDFTSHGASVLTSSHTFGQCASCYAFLSLTLYRNYLSKIRAKSGYICGSTARNDWHTTGNQQSRYRQNKAGNLVSAPTYANGSTAFKSVCIKKITVLLGVTGKWLWGGKPRAGKVGDKMSVVNE